MIVRITPDTLQSWLTNPEVFIMDVRGANAWAASPSKIKNAHHIDPTKPETIRELPRDKKLVVYCA